MISSAFESSCGISVLVQLAAALQPVVVHPPNPPQGGPPPGVSHGLGTLSWFGSDVVSHPLRICGQISSRSGSGSDGIDPGASRPFSACVEDASFLLQGLSDRARHTLQPLLASTSSSSSSASSDDHTEEITVDSADRRLTRLQIPVQIRISGVEDPVSYIIRGTQIQPSGPHQLRRQSSPSWPPFVFLHGFLGSSGDWTPFMRAVAEAGHLAVALDLPGHGGDTPEILRPPFPPPTMSGTPSGDHNNGDTPPGASGGMRDTVVSGSRLGPDGKTAAAAAAASSAPPGGCYGIEAMADAVAAAIRQQLPGTSRLPSGSGGGGGQRRPVLVGYSMGARVALAVAARHPGLVASLVLVSGSAGIEVRGEDVIEARFKIAKSIPGGTPVSKSLGLYC